MLLVGLWRRVRTGLSACFVFVFFINERLLTEISLPLKKKSAIDRQTIQIQIKITCQIRGKITVQIRTQKHIKFGGIKYKFGEQRICKMLVVPCFWGAGGGGGNDIILIGVFFFGRRGGGGGRDEQRGNIFCVLFFVACHLCFGFLMFCAFLLQICVCFLSGHATTLLQKQTICFLTHVCFVYCRHSRPIVTLTKKKKNQKSNETQKKKLQRERLISIEFFFALSLSLLKVFYILSYYRSVVSCFHKPDSVLKRELGNSP